MLLQAGAKDVVRLVKSVEKQVHGARDIVLENERRLAEERAQAVLKRTKADAGKALSAMRRDVDRLLWQQQVAAVNLRRSEAALDVLKNNALRLLLRAWKGRGRPVGALPPELEERVLALQRDAALARGAGSPLASFDEGPRPLLQTVGSAGSSVAGPDGRRSSRKRIPGTRVLSAGESGPRRLPPPQAALSVSTPSGKRVRPLGTSRDRGSDPEAAFAAAALAAAWMRRSGRHPRPSSGSTAPATTPQRGKSAPYLLSRAAAPPVPPVLSFPIAAPRPAAAAGRGLSGARRQQGSTGARRYQPFKAVFSSMVRGSQRLGSWVGGRSGGGAAAARPVNGGPDDAAPTQASPRSIRLQAVAAAVTAASAGAGPVRKQSRPRILHGVDSGPEGQQAAVLAATPSGSTPVRARSKSARAALNAPLSASTGSPQPAASMAQAPGRSKSGPRHAAASGRRSASPAAWGAGVGSADAVPPASSPPPLRGSFEERGVRLRVSLADAHALRKQRAANKGGTSFPSGD